MLSERSVAVSDNELDTIFMTVFINQLLSGETLFCQDYYIIVFQDLQFILNNLQSFNFDVVIEFLKFVQACIDSIFSNVTLF